LQWFGIKLVTLLAENGRTISTDVWSLAIDSDYERVRTVGVAFLNTQTPAQLAEQIDLIAACCRSHHRVLRQGVYPAVADLAGSHGHLAEELVLELYPLILREEGSEGAHEDVLALLCRALPSHLAVIPSGAEVQMLDSEFAAAQELGCVLLQQRADLDETPLPQLIQWTTHEHASLRHYILDYLRDHEPRLLSQLAELTPLVESDWDDVREYSFGLLRERVPEDHWDVHSLIRLCDSVKPIVQDFGREMITRRFREEDGELYLTQLSQHPAREMQWFVTHFLEQHAKGEVPMILGLEHFFRTALGAVNTARLTKSKCQQFLMAEAQQSEQVAQLAHALFHHYSATCEVGDKAFYIKALYELETQWETLDPALQMAEPQQWTAS